MTSDESSFFVIDGPLPHDCPAYIQRPCDEALVDRLRRSQFCWVRGSRHTGKSSLMIRAAEILRKADFRIAKLDLAKVDSGVPPEQSFISLLQQLSSQLTFDSNLKSSTSDAPVDNPVRNFFSTTWEIASGGTSSPLIVFVDNIDHLPELAFSENDFIEAFRDLKNKTSLETKSGPLAFCFLGMMAASDLNSSEFTNPFDPANQIELPDFSSKEAALLATGLGSKKALMDRILYWTNGHPYLTQRVCFGVTQEFADTADTESFIEDLELVDLLCEDLLLSNRANERDRHLNSVREQLLEKAAATEDLLKTYIRIRGCGAVEDPDSNPSVRLLGATGILRIEQNIPRIRNRIYERVFDRDWAMENMPILRSSSSCAIAVMPFLDEDADPLDEFWADGLTEELTNALGQVPGLSVASPGSTFQFKDKPEDLPEIASKLKVEIVLNGVVRRTADRVHIFTELVNVSDGYRLWSGSFDHRAKDLLEIQEHITNAIVERLNVRLEKRDESSSARSPTENIEAYNLYLKGRFYWNKRHGEAVKKSIGLFQDAIGLDPEFALAYAGLADAYNTLGTYNYAPPAQAYPRGKVAALKALEMDERLAQTYAAFGCISSIYDWDWAGAEDAFKCAIDLNPSYAPARQWYAVNCLTPLGRHEESMTQLRNAQAVDPLSLGIQTSVALAYYYARDYEQAIEQCRFTLEMEENFWIVHMFLAWAYLQTSHFDEAVKCCQKASELGKSDPVALAALGHAHALAGNREQASEILGELKSLAENNYVPSAELTFLCLGLEDTEQAFMWLDKAEKEKALRLIYLNVEPRFDPIRTNPRFQELLAKVGLNG